MRQMRKEYAIFTAVLAILTIAALSYYNSNYAQNRAEPGTEHVVQLLLGYENGSTASVNAYLALTPKEQQIGLMYQTSFGNCNGQGNCYGMLFAFQNYSELCFWMKNTVLPLKQFWIYNNTITAEENGSPYSTQTYCHAGDAVLETHANSSLAVGDSIYLR